MKKVLFLLLAGLLAFADATAQLQPAQPQPAPVVIDTQIVGGQRFFVLAYRIDSFLTNVRVVAEPIAKDPPQKTSDWVWLVVKLVSGGIVTSLASQLIKIYKDTVALFSGMRNEWIVLLASFAVAAGWLYAETKFDAFAFAELFARAAKVFTVAIVAYRLVLKRFSAKKPQTA